MSQGIAGRRVLITGGTAGIGQAAALKLAELGASVIISGRDEDRGQRTLQEMRRAAPEQEFAFLQADQLTMAGTRRLASLVSDQVDGLDVLINNAGGFFLSHQLTSDGYERTFALNHLSPFLLTHLLLDLLKSSDDPRVITTSSGSHFNGSIHFDDLQLAEGYSGFKAYSQSKLANVLFTYELNRRASDRFAVNCFHPGFVATRIGFINPVVTLLMKLFYVFGSRTPEQGAASAVHLAADPAGGQISGRYWFDEKPVESSANSYQRNDWVRLWRISEQLVGLEPDLRLAAADSYE